MTVNNPISDMPVTPPTVRAYWTARATLTTIGEGRVELSLDEAQTRVSLPVTLRSEEQVLAALLYQSVVVSIGQAPAAAEKAPDEDLAWHRAEVTRLRDLLARLEVATSTTVASLELGGGRFCILAPTEGAERALLDGLTAWLAERGAKNPEVAAEMEEARQRAYHAEALAGLLTMMVYLPSKGQRLGPGPSALLSKLLKDEAFTKRTQESMSRYLHEHEDESALAGAAVDLKEWGGKDAPKDKEAITQDQFDAWLGAMRKDLSDPRRSDGFRAGVAHALRGLFGDAAAEDGVEEPTR